MKRKHISRLHISKQTIAHLTPQRITQVKAGINLALQYNNADTAIVLLPRAGTCEECPAKPDNAVTGLDCGSRYKSYCGSSCHIEAQPLP
jgi:hypothetical protein